jgi:hypothetical protein
MTQSRLRNVALPIAILIAVTLCYSSTLHSGYIWDDWYLFIHNPSLRLPGIAWSDLAAPVLDGTTYFRPLVFLSFWMEFRLLGVDPGQSHGINLLIHLGSVLLVYLIALRLCKVTGQYGAQIRALIGAGLYGLHPMLVESVAWVSGRFDLLATLFTLLAMYVDLSVRRQFVRIIALGVLFAAALGSKEVSVALPAALLLQRLIVEGNESNSLRDSLQRVLLKNWSSVAVLLTIFIVYLILRYISFQQLFHVNHHLLGMTNSLEDRVFLVFGTLAFYVKAIFYPFSSVGPLHPLDAGGIKGWPGIANVIAGLACLFALGLGTVRRSPVALLLVGGFAALLPVLNLIPLTIADNIGHDRFLTLPLAFCAMALTQIRVPTLTSVSPRVSAPLAFLVLVVWTASAVLITRTAVPQWRNDFTLWSWAYRAYPESLYAQIQVTSAATAQHRYDIATYLFDRFRARGRLDANLQLGYGGMLIAMGERSEGRKYVEGAIIAFPQLHKMTPQQIERLPFGVKRNTEVAFAYRMLAIADLEEGKFDEALESANVALWYKPTFPLFIMTKAFALIGMDREGEAQVLIDAAMDLALPDNRERFRSDLANFISETCTVRREKSPKLCSSRSGR